MVVNSSGAESSLLKEIFKYLFFLPLKLSLGSLLLFVEPNIREIFEREGMKNTSVGHYSQTPILDGQPSFPTVGEEPSLDT